MLIEIKNIPHYEDDGSVKTLLFTTFAAFESVDMKIEPIIENESSPRWIVVIEVKNGRAVYQAKSIEKAEDLYRLIMSAVLDNRPFLSIDLNEWH